MDFGSTKWIVIAMQYRHITTTLALTSPPGPLLISPGPGEIPPPPPPLSVGLKVPLAASAGHGTLAAYIGMYSLNNETAGKFKWPEQPECSP